MTTLLHHHRLRKRHFETLLQAVSLVQAAFDDPAVLQCASRFFRVPIADGRALENLLIAHDCESHFVPWLLWDAELPDGPFGARLAGQLKDKGAREVLRALLRTAVEVWQFGAIGAESVQLVRLRDNLAVTLTDPMLRHGPSQGDLIIGRVVQVGGVGLLDAVHESLPQSCERAMRQAAQHIATLPVEVRLWHLRRAAVLALTEPGRLPRRRSPLHSELARTTLVFQLPAGSNAATLLAQAVHAGTLDAVGPRRFALRRGSKGPAGAILRLLRGRLHASTIRSDKVALLQDAVQAWVPGAVLQLTLHRNLGELFDPVQRERLAKHELHALASDWLSEQLALRADAVLAGTDGQTLREATASRAGKLRVRAWLRRLAPVAQWAEPHYQSALQALTQELFGG